LPHLHGFVGIAVHGRNGCMCSPAGTAFFTANSRAQYAFARYNLREGFIKLIDLGGATNGGFVT
jgi:hypothetical protein